MGAVGGVRGLLESMQPQLWPERRIAERTTTSLSMTWIKNDQKLQNVMGTTWYNMVQHGTTWYNPLSDSSLQTTTEFHQIPIQVKKPARNSTISREKKETKRLFGRRCGLTKIVWVGTHRMSTKIDLYKLAESSESMFS